MELDVREQAKEIIAQGCGCDRDCERFEKRHPDFYCGCLADADKILALFRQHFFVDVY